jgi:Fe-coproporphyrin III synthase
MNNLFSVIDDFRRTAKMEYYRHTVRACHSLIYLTYRCTSQCRTCNIWKRNQSGTVSKELTWKEWKHILSRMKEYGIETVEIFGGDALLRKELTYEAIRFCTDIGIKTYFPTNSILLDKETAQNLVVAGLSTIYFSLDDVGSDHDMIRGKSGAFTYVRNAIENIVKARGNKEFPNIVICTTISNMNYNHFDKIVNFLRDYPINAIYPRILGEFSEININNSVIKGILPEPYFTTSDGTSHLLSDTETSSFRYLMKKTKNMYKNIYINSRGIDMATNEVFTEGVHPFRKCLLCSILVTIDPLGNVNPCPMYNKYHLGNILNERLEKIWGNKEHRYFIDYQQQKKIHICRNCVMRSYYPTFYDTCSYYLKRAFQRLAH